MINSKFFNNLKDKKINSWLKHNLMVLNKNNNKYLK